MASLNKACLIGNVGKDPEVRSFQNGNRAASFSLAMSEHWKDKQTGEKKERTQWVNVVIFDEGLVKLAESYITKGTKLYLEGAIETRKWQAQDGQDRYATEVVLRPFNSKIILLSSKENGGGSQQGGYSKKDEGSFGGQSSAGAGGSFGGESNDFDDSLPF
jgi:single-strand DNA-binding protein